MISRVMCGVCKEQKSQMPNSVDFSGRPFHFIGIGGIGMSALAYVLAKRKLPVSGSDLRANHITQCLQALGTHIFWRQDPANLKFFSTLQELPYSAVTATTTSEEVAGILASPVNDALTNHTQELPQVICSTAIHPDNAEYQAALALGCPVFHRSDLLAALMQDYQSVAVGGTHGKTTTSSLIGYVLLQAGLDPTIVVGGEVNAWQGNARLGAGPYLVAEADESDGSLVKFSAQIGVITNIELDHPDHYETLDQVIDTFKTFASRCQTLIACLDCPTIRTEICSARTSQSLVSYSLQSDSGASYTVDNIVYHPNGTIARVWEGNTVLGQLELKLLGQHNLSNALAAVAVARRLGLDFTTIATAIASFEGARRRFERRGEYNQILFVDDYAHHPSEIRVTLAAARLQVQGSEFSQGQQRRVIAVFQPHRYSRTLTFLTEFSQSFAAADMVIITEIYSAGEPDLGHVRSQQLVDLIAAEHQDVYYKPSLPLVSDFLKAHLQPGDLVIFLGAGNLNQIIPEVMAFHHALEVQSPQEVVFP